MENKTVTRFKELDALRGIAALMVVFFHFTMQKEDYNAVFKYGTTGVDLFFIISGFVIFMSLSKINSAKDFIINRVCRLYPTYWASVTFSFILIGGFWLYRGDGFSTAYIIRYLGNMTMFQYYLRIPDIEFPYWTMIVEMLFYICILLLYITRILKHLNWIGTFLCVLVFVLAHFVISDVWKLLSYWFPLIQFIPLFFAGTLFYKLYTEKKDLIINYSLLAMCFLIQHSLFNFSGRSSTYISQAEYGYMLLLFFIVFVLFVNNKLGFIVNRFTLFFGKISFALYLTHQCISQGFIIPLFYERLHFNFWVTTVLINLPILICIASFITYKIEIPYGKKMKAALRKL